MIDYTEIKYADYRKIYKQHVLYYIDISNDHPQCSFYMRVLRISLPHLQSPDFLMQSFG